jgi:hemoglobin
MTMTTDLDSTAPAEAEAITIYEAIGGRASLVAAVDGLYGRLLADPELGPLFPGGVAPRHRAYVVTILGEALGGPERYRGPDVAGAHRGLRISDAHFDRTAGHLDATLAELGVPQDLADRIIGVVAGLRQAVVTA